MLENVDLTHVICCQASLKKIFCLFLLKYPSVSRKEQWKNSMVTGNECNDGNDNMNTP